MNKLQKKGRRYLYGLLSVMLSLVSLNSKADTQTLINESYFASVEAQMIQVRYPGLLTIQFLNSNDWADRFDIATDFPNGLLYLDKNHQNPVQPTTNGTDGVNIAMTYQNLAAGTYYIYSEYGLKNLKVVLTYEDTSGVTVPQAFMLGNNSGYYEGTINEVVYYWVGYPEIKLNEIYQPIRLIKEGVEVTATPTIIDGNKLKVTFTPEVSSIYFRGVFVQSGYTNYSLFVPAGIVDVKVNDVWVPSKEITSDLYLNPKKTEVFLSDENNVNPFSIVPDIWGPEGAFSYFNCEKDGLYLLNIKSVPSGIQQPPMGFYYKNEEGNWEKVNYSLYTYWWSGHEFEGYVALKGGTTYNLYGISGYDNQSYHNNYASYCTLTYLGEDLNNYPSTEIVGGNVFESPLKKLSLQFRYGDTVYSFRHTPTPKLTLNGENVTDVDLSAAILTDDPTIIEVTFGNDGLTTLGDYTLTIDGVQALFGKNHQYQNPNLTVSFSLTNGDDQTTGVSFIVPDADNMYKVYNLNGVNIMTTGNLSDVLNLPKGIYVINGTKYVVK